MANLTSQKNNYNRSPVLQSNTDVEISTTNLYYPENNMPEQFFNDSGPFVSDAISVCINKQLGRHVIATADLQPGTVLVTEKSTFSTLYFPEIFSHCSNCLARTKALVKCTTCSLATFCSEYCLHDASNRYHTIECRLMLHYSQLDASDNHVPLVVRILAILSKQGTYLEKLKEKWEDLKKQQISHPKQTQWYMIPESLVDLVFYLKEYSYSEKERLHSIFKFRQLVDRMKSNTVFFSNIQSYKIKDTEDFVVLLLWELEARCKINVYGVAERTFDTSKTYDDLFQLDQYITKKTIGLACLQFSNYFNHSCVPNATYSFHGGDSIIVCCSRFVKSGDEITLCYTGPYYDLDKSGRRSKLSKDFGFKCKCEACCKNWPLLAKLKSLSDYKCACWDKLLIAKQITSLRSLCQEETYANISEKLGPIIIKLLRNFEQLTAIKIILTKEYAQLFKLYDIYLEHGYDHRKDRMIVNHNQINF